MDIAKTPLTGVYTLSIDGAVKGALLDDKFQRLIESTASLNGKTARMLTFYITKDVKYSLTGIKVMLNAGDTALLGSHIQAVSHHRHQIIRRRFRVQKRGSGAWKEPFGGSFTMQTTQMMC